MDEYAEFRRQVRDALEHLYDAARLECHPLVAQLVEPATAGRLTRAQALRGLLKEAIEALRPAEDSPASMPGARGHRILHYYFVQGMSFVEMQDELALGRRQLQRELRRGLDAVASYLWRRRLEGPCAPASSSPAAEAGDVQLLQQELEHWQLVRQDCTLQSLLDDTRQTLGPLLGQRRITLQIGALPARPVSVDPTLCRQALTKALQLLIQNARPGAIALEAEEQATTLRVTLRSDGAPIGRADPGWRIASLLMGQQGGDLRLESAAGGAVSVVLSLPLAASIRVLAIDDAEAIHRLFTRYLAPHNYEVVGSKGGPEALRLAADLRPDVITLDVMMPSRDGWQLLRDLQSNPATAGIPVVVCSVLNEPDLALSLGARAFVEKPVGRLELLAALESARARTAPGAAATQGAPAGN